MYFVYLLTNRWKTVLYTGMTDSIPGQIKGWTRAKKNALIATMNPDWNDLSAEGILRSAQDVI
jgi:predicted GIY-YIG superfamily endonuclease